MQLLEIAVTEELQNRIGWGRYRALSVPFIDNFNNNNNNNSQKKNTFFLCSIVRNETLHQES